VSRLAYERDHRLEGLVRVVQQDVALPDGGEDVVPLVVAEGNRERGDERRVLEIRPIDLGEREQVAHPERRLDRDHVGSVHIEVLHQDVADVLRHRGFNGHAHDRAESPLPDALLDGLEQVVGLELLDHHLSVAGDAERVRLDHVVAREQRPRVCGHQLLEPHERVRAPRFGPLGRDRHEPRQRLGHLHAGEAVLAVRAGHHDRDVHAQVRDVREGPTGIERERCKHREDRRGEVGVCHGALRVAQLGVGEQLDAGGREFALQLPEAVSGRGKHPRNPLPHQSELLGCREPVVGDAGDAGCDLLLEAGHANHVELGEVRAEDREILRALQKRIAGIERLFEHALLECEQRDLTVHIQLRSGELHRRSCRHPVLPPRVAPMTGTRFSV